jgi:hypothetical protein
VSVDRVTVALEVIRIADSKGHDMKMQSGFPNQVLVKCRNPGCTTTWWTSLPVEDLRLEYFREIDEKCPR